MNVWAGTAGAVSAGAVSAGAVSAGAARWPLAGFAWLPGSPTGGHHLKRRKIRTQELRENVHVVCGQSPHFVPHYQ